MIEGLAALGGEADSPGDLALAVVDGHELAATAAEGGDKHGLAVDYEGGGSDKGIGA